MTRKPPNREVFSFLGRLIHLEGERCGSMVVKDATRSGHTEGFDEPGATAKRCPAGPVNGARILCQALEREGVEVVFGYPGGAVIPLYDVLPEFGLHHVLVRHEQCAAHAADGLARVTGKGGVCLATSGPGATNLVTGLATAM